MATRMQQRRGTAAQWISTNSGNGPILAAGEIGYESDTNKFKIGDGTNTWLTLDYFIDSDSTVNPQFGSNIKFEGTTANNFETTLEVTDPTADRTLTLPDATGTVAITTDISDAITNAALDTSDDLTEGATNLYYTTARSALKANLASPTFTGTVNAAALTLSGDLTVNGTTTTINSTTLAVDDKNIVLGDVDTPSDTTADGGGITLKGATDKTFNWVDATDAWTSSEHVNLASGKTLKYNGTDLVASQSGNSGKYLTTNGTASSWAAVITDPTPSIFMLMGA
jgi:hypothetical protein